MIEIPGYKIHKRVYEGLSTHVYQAVRTTDDHPVIIKVSAQKRVTEKKVQRFHREFEIGQKISSPYVMRYLELKQDPAYGMALIMEDNQAIELTAIILTHSFSTLEFLALAIQIVEGLQAIHAANIVHNDLKPSNILLQPRILTATVPTETANLGESAGYFSIGGATYTVKIIDFDQASFLRQKMQPAVSTHQSMGTLEYLSPEQTGRINRSVDYRTDFYSLGVVFYRLLCGQLPFTATDALGLIHQHLAKPPLPPHHCKPTIALSLSQLVMKLLEKEAENRYQSCEGILYDLNYCLTNWRETGIIPEFRLAQQDVSNKLTLSQHLYGRDNEINILLQAFERVSRGSRGALMVTGEPGVGKSRFIQEVQKPITLKSGYFLSGKFDQLNKNVAYSALSQAFEGLIGQLLTEDEASIANWKQKLLKALGNQAQLVVQILPTLTALIGPQSPAQIADPGQAKTVFNLVFLEFIKLFADASHPLVLFLDDLQWADNASLELMTFLLSQPGVQHVLWLGAYQDTEVIDARSTLQALTQLREAQISVQTLRLAPLSLDSLKQWITDSLHMSLTATQPLVELIHQKTAGNPFFVQIFLQALYDQQLLSFSPKIHWQWDLTQIRQHPATENVITLMTYQVQQLPDTTRKALTMASCLGHHVVFGTLQIALASSLETVCEVLHPALNSGILLQTEDGIRFVHDRMQEVAYSLLAETEKARTHLTLGQRLLTSPAGEEALLFETVAQFNHCHALISEPQERLRIARLNLKAAQKAKQATLYAVALKYFQANQDWIDVKTLWKTDYPLAFTWQKELAEVEYLNGHFNASEDLIKNMQPYLQSTLDKVDSYHLLIIQKTLQGLHQEAIKLGHQALQLLGNGLPLDNLTEFIEKTASELKQKLDDRPISSLLDIPLATMPEKQAIFKILASIYSACYQTGTELLTAITLMAIKLSLTSGHALESCHSYAAYGLLLCGKFQEYALGYQFGQLAIQLAEKLQSSAQHCKSSIAVVSCVYPWSKSIQQLPALLTATYELSLASSQPEFAGYCAIHKVQMLFYQGIPLARVQQETLPLLLFAQSTKNQITINVIQAIQRLLANLRGDTRDEWSFDIDSMDETQFEQRCQQSNSFSALCLYYIHKALAFYLYDHFKQALSDLTLAKKNLVFIISNYATANFNYYDSLTRLALYSTLSIEDQQTYLQQVVQNQQQMAKWQASCRENFAHKYLLVEAELARLKGNHEQAEAYYDQAIELASLHGFVQEQALAAERAAQYWLARGKLICAQGYLNTAFNSYKQWGAKRKIELLKTRYADLLQTLAPPSLSQIVVNQETTLSGNTLRLLDLSSILKASQTISNEIELPKLLRSMMQLIIENAGAQKGAVLFVEADEAVFVQAEYASDGALTTLQKIPLADWDKGSPAVIQYVKRLHKTVVVDNATTHKQFKMDPYVSQMQTKSILCIPILKHAVLKALLYAENNLLSHAFTSERVQTVLILTTQMAISLENARYFAEQIALTRQLAEQSTRAQMAEESLHAVTYDLQFALQASKAGTWNWQLSTNNITWNAGNYALFGLTPSEFKGTYEAFLACVHPEDRERIGQGVKRCIEQDIPYDIEYRVIWPDGSQHVLAAQGHVYRDLKGTPIKMAGVCLDITQRKQLEQERLEALKKADEERIRREEALHYQQNQKEFMENVCHEIRNPLQGLIGATGLLKADIDLIVYQQKSQPELKALLDSPVTRCEESVTIIEECTKHLQTLLDDVLNLAKLSANKMELIIGVFQPKAMLQSVAKMFTAKMMEKKLVLHLKLPTEEIFIKGDAQRLKQVVINLLANALKFTEKGSITLELKVLGVTTTHTQLEFVVADTGIGMTAEEMARLFKPFSQASANTAGKYGGTGLGLQISDKFIRLMNGQITVKSKKGEGTQFSFVVECENAEPKAVPLTGLFTAFKPTIPTVTKLSVGKILIVDDTIINQKILSRMLQDLGYATHTANNGQEAVQYFTEAGPFSLIFMDMEMPVMKGDEATQQIRQIEQDRKLSPTPIICTTGHAENEYQKQILSGGMNALLIKPFNKEDVYKILKTWVKISPLKESAKDSKSTSSSSASSSFSSSSSTLSSTNFFSSSSSSSSFSKSATPLQSNLSDEKVVKELTEILTQLNAESISKESDNPSSTPSAPIILSAPQVPVEGQQLEAERKAFLEGRPLFEKLLAEKGLAATSVSGHGLNCFIYSLLQHVTGRYDVREFAEPLVGRIKEVAKLSPGSPATQYGDTLKSLNIIKAINQLYQVNLEVRSVRINRAGKSIVLSPLFDTNALGQRQPVMLWLQVTHYVAITSNQLKLLNEQLNTARVQSELKKAADSSLSSPPDVPAAVQKPSKPQPLKLETGGGEKNKGVESGSGDRGISSGTLEQSPVLGFSLQAQQVTSQGGERIGGELFSKSVQSLFSSPGVPESANLEL